MSQCACNQTKLKVFELDCLGCWIKVGGKKCFISTIELFWPHIYLNEKQREPQPEVIPVDGSTTYPNLSDFLMVRIVWNDTMMNCRCYSVHFRQQWDIKFLHHQTIYVEAFFCDFWFYHYNYCDLLMIDSRRGRNRAFGLLWRLRCKESRSATLSSQCYLEGKCTEKKVEISIDSCYWLLSLEIFLLIDAVLSSIDCEHGLFSPHQFAFNWI